MWITPLSNTQNRSPASRNRALHKEEDTIDFIFQRACHVSSFHCLGVAVRWLKQMNTTGLLPFLLVHFKCTSNFLLIDQSSIPMDIDSIYIDVTFYICKQ